MALLKVLLLLGLGVSVKSNVSLQKRIIGGQNCDDTEHLYHVRLESSRGEETIRCGGSLIHPQWILTAARCWQDGPGWTNTAMLKVHPRTAGQRSHVIRDRPVIYTRSNRKHDIMLLKLPTPVTDVQPAQIPSCRRHLKLGDTVQLAGEALTTIGPNKERLPIPSIAGHLQCVNMQVVSGSYVHLTLGQMVRVEAPTKDVCLADYGGAAMFDGKIYGVIAFSGRDYTCQIPTSILDVCEYKEWIRSKIFRGP